MRRSKVVGYLARVHGFAGLEHLVASDRYEVVCVFTHRRLAKFEDLNRGDRPDFPMYEALCAERGIPLVTVDNKREMKRVDEALAGREFDLIACISWRRIIPPKHLYMPRIGAVNLHRGKFPEYTGNFPVVRALEDGREEIHITAHVMTEEIDAGDILKVVRHPFRFDNGSSLDENVERAKLELTPSFGPLLLDALDLLRAGPGPRGPGEQAEERR